MKKDIIQKTKEELKVSISDYIFREIDDILEEIYEKAYEEGYNDGHKDGFDEGTDYGTDCANNNGDF